MSSRPFLNKSSTSVIIGGTTIPWDAESGRPINYLSEAGRIYQAALDVNGMTEPDPWAPPPDAADRLDTPVV